MLFAQIIAFILVMAVFESYRPGPPALGPGESLVAAAALLLWLWGGCRLAASWFLRRLAGGRRPPDPARAARALVFRLHLLGLACLLAMFTVLDLKAHWLSLPLVAGSEALGGLFAAGLYFLHLAVVWSAAHPVERVALGQDLDLGAYVAGQLRLAAPVAFPWLGVSLVRDFLALFWPRAAAWLGSGLGDLVFIGLAMTALALAFPPLVRHWWGCRPIPPGPRRQIMEAVLNQAGVRVGALLYWPVLGGRMLTAGILGMVPRLNYLLITPALAEALTAEELAGVVAHEAGHVRHRHLLYYLFFFLGFFVLAYALAEPLAMLSNALLHALTGTAWGLGLLTGQGGGQGWFSALTSLPLVLLLILYVRFVMGFFMRHFERQADFFAMDLLGGPRPIAQALEKVALLSGDSRRVPSWHHFSIAQRTQALWANAGQPQAARRQGRLLRRSLALYLAGLLLVAGLGWGLQALDLGQGLRQALVMRLLEDRLRHGPRDAQAYLALGGLRFEQGDEAGALHDLRLAQALAPRDAEVLNSLAWVLATAQREELRSPAEALELALEAVALAPRPHIWDTLAEAYLQNGQPQRALAAARAALAAGPRERLDYYQAQLERFARAARLAGPGQEP
ncbi:MAG: M48 family metalloprotease [Desulfarculus sp.]|nr:M48 family metalloprotease [Desulfarculus sp.]